MVIFIKSFFLPAWTILENTGAEEFKDNYLNLSTTYNKSTNSELNAHKKFKNSQNQKGYFVHYFSGYKQKEVSTILKKSEKATESLIIRARS